MSDSRLPAATEAALIGRSVESSGGHYMIVRRGDPDRGALLLQVTEKGAHCAFLERALARDGNYEWRQVGPAHGSDSAEISDFLRKRSSVDPDSWLIELNVAEAERFIAETIAFG